jgi:DNA-binding XRE family transcriptional regulator
VSSTNGGSLRLDEHKVRQARERLGLTVAMAAQRAGTSKNTFLSAEHGGDLRPPTASKIAKALNVQITDLLREEPDHPLAEAQPSVQLTINGVLAEELRRPTDSEISALDRWISYLEQRLNEHKLGLDEIKHALDAASASAIRKAPDAYPHEIHDRFMRLVRRMFEEGKSFTELHAELKAEVNRSQEAHRERQT